MVVFFNTIWVLWTLPEIYTVLYSCQTSSYNAVVDCISSFFLSFSPFYCNQPTLFSCWLMIMCTKMLRSLGYLVHFKIWGLNFSFLFSNWWNRKQLSVRTQNFTQSLFIASLIALSQKSWLATLEGASPKNFKAQRWGVLISVENEAGMNAGNPCLRRLFC